MKPSTITNHEKWIAAETKKEAKIALELLRHKVFKATGPIVDALIVKALDGDHKTAELLFDRAWGKAKESLDVNVQFSLIALAERAKQLKLVESDLVPTSVTLYE
ncbi:MAG: hypothetical protein Q7S52_05405 [bacterium]|nr:hypothetical protein [bacterium]